MYSRKEEVLNIWTHGLADLCFVILGGILLYKLLETDYLSLSSAVIYVSSLILLYTASTCYHSAKEGSVLRSRLRILDHVAIYILIAGSYTPFCLVAMEDSGGISLFIWVWSIALIGSIVKIFFTGKLNIISTLGYVFMGWLIVFYWSDLKESVSSEGIQLLIYGGILYSIGAVLYVLPGLKYNHAIFHVFIFAGSLVHFWGIYSQIYFI